jgi:hypothetical protein
VRLAGGAAVTAFGKVALVVIAASLVALAVVWLGGMRGFYVMGTSVAFGTGGTYPRLPGRDASRPFAGDPAAPRCPPVEVPTAAAGWSRRTPGSTTTRLSDLSVPLPAGWRSDDRGRYTDGEGEHWGHIMGSWVVPPPADRRTPPWTDASLSMWIGNEEGYPSYGRGDAQQGALRECRFDGPAGEAFLVAYELETPDGVEHVVSAYWPVVPGAWLGATAITHAPTRQSEAVAALHGVRFTPAR